MSAIYYQATDETCSVTFPIVTVIDKKYVLIGPEFKHGVVCCMKYSDFDKLLSSPRVKGGSNKCFDVAAALRENFMYIGGLTSDHLTRVLAIYFGVAKKCNIFNLVPNVLLGLLSDHDKLPGIDMYVAKILESQNKSVEHIREVYFTKLNPDLYKDIIFGSSEMMITQFIPGIIKFNPVPNEEIFKSMMVNLVRTIEHNAKYLNFIHGTPHIGHVNLDGILIDFGHSFNFYDSDMVEWYIKKYIPKSMKPKVGEKYKIQQLDVVCAFTLVEIMIFIDSMMELGRFKNLLIPMKEWILETLGRYFDEDVSIFTMLKQDDFSNIFTGGDSFQIPPEHSKIDEKFPTTYFLEAFGLISEDSPHKAY